jgi:hypothetical protein
LAGLLYGCEAGNHTALEMTRLAAFHRFCWWRLSWRVVAGKQPGALRQGQRLRQLLTEIQRRRVAFACQLVARPVCELARRMLFAEVAVPEVHRSKSKRTAYHNVVGRDLAELAGGNQAVTLGQLVATGRE